MSSTNPGRQSPDPEDQTSKQVNAPSDGQGVNDSSNTEANKDQSKKDLEGLSSNPKGPLDDHVKDTAKKTIDNNA